MQNIAAAARRRMLSDKNPMKDPKIHQAAMAKVLSRQISKTETRFIAFLEAKSVDMVFTGQGSLWIGRRNPDFRVPGQKKCLELTQKECFIGYRKRRDWMNYGVPTIQHYRKKKWACLVIFVKDRTLFPSQLVDTVKDFASTESRWSGVWQYDRLILF